MRIVYNPELGYLRKKFGTHVLFEKIIVFLLSFNLPIC